jgi:hypothetical protein
MRCMQLSLFFLREEKGMEPDLQLYSEPPEPTGTK